MRVVDWHQLWAPQWSPQEVILRATVVYAFTLTLVRVVGRKELSRYATHDLVLLFLIATAVRQTMVGTDTSLTSGLVALATITAWDTLLSYAVYRSRRTAVIVDRKLRRLIRNGHIQDEELRRVRISREELVSLLRRHGHEDLGRVRDAYMERSGRVTFVLTDDSHPSRG
jgi:uncharacterized membrane protein YcaP (DUF421 family)